MSEMKTYVDIGCTIFTQPKPVNNHQKFGIYCGGYCVLGLMLKAVVGVGATASLQVQCDEGQLSPAPIRTAYN